MSNHPKLISSWPKELITRKKEDSILFLKNSKIISSWGSSIFLRFVAGLSFIIIGSLLLLMGSLGLRLKNHFPIDGRNLTLMLSLVWAPWFSTWKLGYAPQVTSISTLLLTFVRICAVTITMRTLQSTNANTAVIPARIVHQLQTASNAVLQTTA